MALGLWRPFRFAAEVAQRGTGGESGAPGARSGVRMPWTVGQLSNIVLADIFGADMAVPTRADAMRVPGIAKGRSLICGTLARQPLAKFRGDARVTPDAWMYRTNSQVAPQVRMAWTLDDLIFQGSALWAVERNGSGQITDAIRIPPEWWEIDADLQILVNGVPAKRNEVILFEGPQDPLLEIARDAILAARAMTRAWSQRVDVPTPLLELHITDPNFDLIGPEADALVESWETARRRGGTALTPQNVEVKDHGQAVTDLFVEGRNAERIDFANYLSLPASLLDGTTATASLTYSTQEGRRNELVDLSLAFWATPIEARLSMDDVCPRGQRIAFDLEYLSTPNQPAQGPASED